MAADPAGLGDASVLPLGPGVTVLAAGPGGLIALSKPAGVRSHPNAPGVADPGALLATPYGAGAECFAGAGGPIWLLHRLDAATSGVILVATREDTARRVRGQFASRDVRKVYRAVVFGLPGVERALWRDRLEVRRGGAGGVRTAVATGPGEGRAATAAMRLVAAGGTTSLLELTPGTGRTHQLRVQCARHGLPIVNDETYGDFRRNRAFARATGIKRLLLHALRIEVPGAGEGAAPFVAEAPEPGELAAALRT